MTHDEPGNGAGAGARADAAATTVPRRIKARAYLVHVYTAVGVVLAFLALAETYAPEPDPRLVFAWLILAVLVDASDGPLARRWRVKDHAARIEGRTIDDVADYLNYTFVPLMLVWRMGWVPEPAALWVAPAMLVSLLGFANAQAKQEEEGFFLGFPSYWNVFAFYAGIVVLHVGPRGAGVALVVLMLLTLLPLRFIYPNRAPRPWRATFVIGGAVWMLMLLAMLPEYPRVPAWLLWASLAYPALYVGASIVLDLRARTTSR